MNRFVALVRQRWDVARSNPLAWLNLALLAGTVVVLWVWPGPVVEGTPSDTRLRLWALFLLLIGGVAALVDLIGGASEHGHPGIIRNFSSWVRAMVYRRDYVLHLESATHVITGFSPRLKVRRPTDAAQSDEKRIEGLEFNLDKVDQDLDGVHRALDARAAELKARIDAETRRREAAVEEINRKMRDAALGNFALLLFGAWWVLVGTVLSALSPEIVRIVARHGAAVLRSL